MLSCHAQAAAPSPPAEKSVTVLSAHAEAQAAAPLSPAEESIAVPSAPAGTRTQVFALICPSGETTCFFSFGIKNLV